MPCHGKYYNTGILKRVIEHFPMVLIDKQVEGIQVSSVRTDNYAAMKALVDYLERLEKNGLVLSPQRKTELYQRYGQI